jgi:hypothetical protein
MFSNFVRRFGWAICLVCGVVGVDASPIQYSFTGTLSQPYNGATHFSGTFTYNTDLPIYPGIQPSPGWQYYSGVPTDPTAPPVSLTFHIGSFSSTSLGGIASDEVIVAHTQSNDGFYFQEAFNYTHGQNLTAEIGMVNNNLVQRAPFSSLDPPGHLSLSEFSMGSNLTFWGRTADGQEVNVVGTVTSLVAISSVPEPGSLLVFTVLGAGFLRCRRRRATANQDLGN